MKTFVMLISFAGGEVVVRKVVKADTMPDAFSQAYREAGVYGSVESIISMDAERIHEATDKQGS